MGVSENDFWNGMGFLLKGKSSRRCQRSPAKASRWRGTARQQSLQSLQSLRRCRRGVESVEVQEIKNRCVCCVKCEPKGFHQLLQKKKSFLWRFEAQLLAYVALGIPMQSYMCLWIYIDVYIYIIIYIYVCTFYSGIS